MRVELLDRDRALAVMLDRHVRPYAVVGDEVEALRMAIIRQAASRLGPCPRSVLVDAVATSLRSAVPDDAGGSAAIDRDVEALIGVGDLIRSRSADAERPGWLIYAAPPVFVRRSDRTAFLLGAIPYEAPFRGMRLWGPYRELTPLPSIEEIQDHGLSEYPLDEWLCAPRPRTTQEVKMTLDRLLAEAGPAGDLKELLILDPARPRSYYIGRFVPPKQQSGTFIARRKRTWGGSRWIYAELDGGVPRRFIDLPRLDTRFTGQDEARWIICAIDAHRGQPQAVRVHAHPEGGLLAFETPLPGWAERRLLTVGELSPSPPKGSLMAVAVRRSEVDSELEFLGKALWMEAVKA